jgi:hypothetical protein
VVPPVLSFRSEPDTMTIVRDPASAQNTGVWRIPQFANICAADQDLARIERCAI